jgi:hypothetical protein
MTGSRTASRPLGAPASPNTGSRFKGPEVPEAEQLSFSIAQSAQSFIENDIFTHSNPPATASTLSSIRVESSSVELLPRKRASYQQAQIGHPSLVKERNRIYETSSIQQLRRSARIRGQEPGSQLKAS